MSSDYLIRLQDPKWKEKADQIRVQRKHTCECCGTKNAAMQIHHIYYQKGLDPWGYDDECYSCLCPKCHRIVHAENKKVSSLLSYAAICNSFDYIKIYNYLKLGGII